MSCKTEQSEQQLNEVKESTKNEKAKEAIEKKLKDLNKEIKK